MRRRNSTGGSGARRLISFAADSGGSTALEFSIIALPMLLMLLGTLEYGVTFFAAQLLDSYAEQSSRGLLTGTVQKQGLTAAQYRSQICAGLPSLFSCKSLYLDVNTTTSFSTSDTSAPVITYDASGAISTPQTFKPGGPGDIVVCRFVYAWPVIGLPYGALLGPMSGSSLLMQSTTVLKNEPYQ